MKIITYIKKLSIAILRLVWHAASARNVGKFSVRI